MRSQFAVSPSAVVPGRIDRARFDAATFPTVVEMQLRFDDLDVNAHVNNVAVILLLQEARVHFDRTLALPEIGSARRTVVAAMNVEYGGELLYPGTVEISSGIVALGRSSFTFGQLIRQNSVSAVYSQITMVVTDAQGPVPLPADLRSAIERTCLIPG